MSVDVILYEGYARRDANESVECWENVAIAPREGERVTLRKDLGRNVHARQVLSVEWFNASATTTRVHCYITVGPARPRST